MPLPGLGVIERVMGCKRRRPDEAETDASGLEAGARGRRRRLAAATGVGTSSWWGRGPTST